MCEHRAPQTTRDMWREAVRAAPDRLAIVDGDRRMTYAEADERAAALAAAFCELTKQASPKVAAFLPNCLDYYLLYWAVVRLGGTIVPLNTWLKQYELTPILDNVAPDIVVVRSANDEACIAAGSSCAQSRGGGGPRGPGARGGGGAPPPPPPPPGGGGGGGGRDDNHNCTAAESSGIATVTIADLLASHAKTTEDMPPSAPEALAIIMHTSGTTGTPKGAVMRHCDLMFNVATAINAHDFCSTDVHLVTSPMFHCGPFYTSLPTAAHTKTPVVLAAPTRPDELLRLVERERITTFMSAPSVFRQLLKVKDLGDYDVSSLRIVAYAGSPMDSETIRRLRESFPGVALHNFFGLTETIGMTHVLRDADADTRTQSIGRLLPDVEAIVVDDDLKEVAPGEIGELLFGRRVVVQGYYNQPGRLEQAIVTLNNREWFRTGDYASVDADGYFTLKGRKKDMIIVGGENVYAGELETFLMAHPDVREAAVKGVPATGARAFLGEQVIAYVVKTGEAIGERELRAYCFERLPSYKVPQRVLFLDELPRNPSGKVMKAELPEP